jgi:hypothetical protein
MDTPLANGGHCNEDRCSRGKGRRQDFPGSMGCRVLECANARGGTGSLDGVHLGTQFSNRSQGRIGQAIVGDQFGEIRKIREIAGIDFSEFGGIGYEYFLDARAQHGLLDRQ